MGSKRNVYVYILLNPLKKGSFKYSRFLFKEEPFYVGVGVNRRYHYHFNNFSKSHKSNVIKSILGKGKKPTVLFFKKDITRKEADKVERDLIKIIGRFDVKKGPLTNKTDGGFNSDTSMYRKYKKGKKISTLMKFIRSKRTDCRHSSETKKKISFSLKNLKKTTKHKKSLKKAWVKRKEKGLYIKKHSLATKNKISRANKGKPSPMKGKKIKESVRLKIIKTKRLQSLLGKK